MSCIFCKIVAKEIPNFTVYEDENILAFLDINPMTTGHTVVVPKEHFAALWGMNTETFDLMARGLRAAAGRVQARLKPDGMNIGINNGKAAGQAVPHVHWHIVPRWEGDSGGSVHSIIKSNDAQPAAIVAKKFE
jgi:histidine triad (HIT) family protein